jgi:hypothetical protein
MKKLIAPALGLAIASLAFSAQAADVAVAAVIGTTGFGAQVSLPLSDELHARFGINGASKSENRSVNGVSYDLDLKLKSFDALLDYYPSASNFRVSAGLVFNGNKFNGSARPGSASYVFNGRSYPTATVGQVDANVDFRGTAPYLGIGWGNGSKTEKGWSFTSDFGVMFTGEPDATLTSRNCTGPLCVQLASDILVEQTKLRDDLNSFKYFPVLRVGVSYRF